MSEDLNFNQEMIDYVVDLVNKADIVNAKTESHCNLHLDLDGLTVPVRVDDIQLLYIGARLLPNILNYLLNIIPQFLYPYVVSYLQGLSDMREDPITVNELYNYLISLEENGNIHECTETQG